MWRNEERPQGLLRHLQKFVFSFLALLRNRVEHQNSLVENETLDD